MKKLIELDAAIKATWKDTGYTDPLNVMTAIRDRIEALPTVDAVPVIRCKDCKWGQKVSGNIECFADRNVPPEYHGYEWYCPNGERKKDDEHYEP